MTTTPGCPISWIGLLVAILGAPAIAAPGLEQFLRYPDLVQVEISPDGRHLAHVWNRARDNARIVTIRDLSQEEQPVVGMYAHDIVRPSSVAWANNERLLVKLLVPFNTQSVTRESKRKEDFDINDYFMFRRTVAIDVDGENTVILLDEERGLTRNVNLSSVKHFLPNDPQHVLMSADRNGILALYKVNVYTGDADMLVKGDRNTYAFLSDETGLPLFRLDYSRSRKRIEIYEQDDEDEWRKVNQFRLADIEEYLEFSDEEFVGIADDKLVYHRFNEDSGFKELVLFDPDTEVFETLASEPGRDILYPLLSSRSDDIVGYAVDGDVIRSRYFDETRQADYDNIARLVGDRYFHITSTTDGFDLGVVHVHGPDNPRAYYFYSPRSGKLEFFANSFLHLSELELSRHEKIVYEARDGQEITAYVLLPQIYEPGKPLPLVILPHGGPQIRDRIGYDDFAQFVSTRGYIVIQPNFRGSTGYGRAFEEAGYREWGQLMQDDLTDAVEHMIAQGYADPARVCIVGLSYGGYAALMGAIRTPGLYQCSISINGVTHLRDLIANDAREYGDRELVDEYLHGRVGHPKHDREMLEQNSPALQAEKINVPVLLIAGADDQVVLYSQSRRMARALTRHDKQHRIVRLKDTGHNPFRNRENIETVYTAVEDFLALHLSP